MDDKKEEDMYSPTGYGFLATIGDPMKKPLTPEERIKFEQECKEAAIKRTNRDRATFCKVYKTKLAADKDIQGQPDDGMDDLRNRITFRINYYEFIPRTLHLTPFGYKGRNVLELEPDVMEYLYLKYYNGLPEELRREVDEYKPNIRGRIHI